MTHDRPDPETAPRNEDDLLDLLQGELETPEAARLGARLETDPELAATHAAFERLFAAERAAFEPAGQREALEAGAARVAAWVRSTAGAGDVASVRRRPAAPAPRRGWARVLAFSVALHVLVLGVIALLGVGTSPDDQGAATRVSFEAGTDFSETEPDYAGTEVAVRYQELILEDPSDISDRVVRAEQETVADFLPESEVTFRSRRPLNHPVGVYVPMKRRRHPALKRRRLNLLGFNAKGTLTAVERGLGYLASAQESDGSMAPGGGRGRMEQTGVVLLAFMADGHCSNDKRQSANGKVVARGVDWLRGELFSDPSGGRLLERTQTELGVATVVLCEDYMLSYGWLSPAMEQQRRNEISKLTAAVRDAESTTPADRVVAVERPWSVWAIDAASRAGVITSELGDRQQFSDWVAAAVGTESSPGGASHLSVLALGTALLFEERGPRKPRFTAWGKAHREELVASLDARGRSRTGDPVGDTALILLTLQTPYRTY